MRWVTIERVQVDRLASAWLIRQFVDTEVELSEILWAVDEVHGPVTFRDIPLHETLAPHSPQQC